MSWRFAEEKSFRELDRLIKDTKTLANSGSHGFLVRYLTNYGYIRTTGYLENQINALAKDYSVRTSPKEMQTFFEKQFKNASGYDGNGILKFLARFSTDWHEKLNMHKDFDNEGPWKTSIDSLYAIRHSQAHGGSNNGNLSQLGDYAGHTRDLIHFIANDCFAVPP